MPRDRQRFIKPSRVKTNNRIFTFIVAFTAQHGYSPTYREIGAEVGIAYSMVPPHLDRLESLGYITLPHGDEIGQTRSIALNQCVMYFSPDEWHLMRAAWGDNIKEEIIVAAEQTRFVVTNPQ